MNIEHKPEEYEDPVYHVKILRAMICQLPEKIRDPILSQLTVLLECINNNNKLHLDYFRKVHSLIKESLVDLQMDLKYVEFDLEATKRERDEYKKGNNGS